MAKCSFCDLMQNDGMFEVRGLVVGTKNDKFYEEKSSYDANTKTSKSRRSVNFGVQFDKDKSIYINLMGFPKKEVVYYGKLNPNDEKNSTIKVPWANRLDKQADGMRLIGVNLGITKRTNENGETINNNRTWTEYDACEVISRELQDEASVYVKGKLEFSSFPSKNNPSEVIRRQKFVPNQISLTNKPIVFEEFDEKNKPSHHFTQNIILTEVVQDSEEKCFWIKGYVVTYRTIERVELKTYHSKLAKTLKKVCQKDYVSVDVSGYMEVIKNEEEVEVSDEWGDTNTMKRVNAPTIRELIVTGADPSTVNETDYTKELVDSALAKLRETKEAEEKFGKEKIQEANDWGSAPTLEIASDPIGNALDSSDADWDADWSE